MAFSEPLAARIRDSLVNMPGVEAKTMFGGIGFLLHGNMLVGVWKTSLIVRVGPDENDTALRMPHVKEFDITGRAMKGWVMVDANGVENEDQLNSWIAKAAKFVEQLPRKQVKQNGKPHGSPGNAETAVSRPNRRRRG